MLMRAVVHVRWMGATFLVAALAGASACQDDLLGPAATNECDPLADPAVPVTWKGLTSDGQYVAIVGEGSAARAFYGIPVHMVEGAIKSTRSGCALEVDFEVQGRAYTAVFSPDAARCMIASWLLSGDPSGPTAKSPLTVLEVAGAPADAGTAGFTGAPLTFYCL
jgi:hypothetical protein